MAARGRKPTPAPEPEVLPAEEAGQVENALVDLRQAERSTALAVSQRDAAVRAVAVQIGYQLPADCVDADLIQRDIAASMRRTVEAMIEVGRGLIVLREACQHGEFMSRLDVLGMDHRAAQRYMQVVRKFANATASTQLIKAAGTQSKLLEMLVLDDEEVEELALTGQTGELSLDEVATLSVKELRAKLREAKAENKAQAELLAEKNARLDEERAKNKRIAAAAPDEQFGELLKESGEHLATALGAINGPLRAAFGALKDFGERHTDAIATREVMGGYVDQLQALLNELRDDFMLRDQVGDGMPEWMRATADDVDLTGAEA